MAINDMTHIRKLLGDAWVDAEVLGKNPTHLLGRWQVKDPDNILIKYTDRLIGVMLTAKNMNFNSEVMANKLKSKQDFVSTLAEMESAIFLAQQGFAVTLEPTGPQKGPDLRAEWHDVPYFVEIRSVGFSNNEERRDSVSKEIFDKLNKVPSSYHVTLTVGEEYKPGSPDLKDAIKAVVESLNALKERNAVQATLNYAGKNEAVLIRPGVALSDKSAAILVKANFVARFERLKEEHPATLASFLEARKNPAEPVKDHIRLKKILDDKRDQLPKGFRGIIVLDVSELFMLSEFSIERALYGDWLVQFPSVSGSDAPEREIISSRNNRGFFLHTSRVSAVVIHRRNVKDGEVASEWHIYPTNRANEDTIRLTLVELGRFGNIGDRQHLSADNAPNQKQREN